MQSTRTLSDKIFLILKGLGMGAANKVPGVSGGVVAFVAGFYEEFIYSLQKINGKALKLLVNGRFTSFYRYTNARFLGLLFLGMIISYFSVSKILDYLIANYELYVWSVFFGMIVGSIYYINKDFKDWNIKTVIALISGIAIGLSISFLDPAKENDNLWFVFFCGIISVSGMALPGFSGSFILILLGNYVLLLVDSVNALYDTIFNILAGDFSFTENPVRIRMLKVISVFTLGSFIGLVTFSHAISYVLKHFKNITLSVIMGFIIGSLGVVWPWKETIYKTIEGGSFLLDSTGEKVIENYKRFIPELSSESFVAIVYIVLGILIVLTLEWYGKKTRKVMSKFGLIGKNIDYSFSKSYFTNKFESEKLPHSYQNFDIESIERFKNIVKTTEGLKGLNITIPYKETIMPFLDEIDEKAQNNWCCKYDKNYKKQKLNWL